jgi:hypothetical protein
MSSVSLSCLIEEPSTASERDLFINAFLPALKQAIRLKECHITHVRLVQEDEQSTGEFFNVFKNYVD